jgi:AraC-like DNA-binding protein
MTLPRRTPTATDQIDWGRLAQMGRLDPREPSDALPEVLTTAGRASDEVMVIEQRSRTGPLYLPPMARYSVVTRLDDVAKVMAWQGSVVEHRDARHESFIVPPFQQSFFCSRAPAHSLSITLAPSLFSRLMQDEARAGTRVEGLFSSHGRADGVLCGLALAALTQVRSGGGRGRGVIRCIGEAVALHLIERHTPQAVSASPAHRLTAAQLSQLGDYVHEHLSESLPISRLAAVLGLGATQFSRAFKQARGESPLQWLQRLRMERAHALIVGTQRPITAIAMAVGHDDLPHFSRLFSRHWGHAPSHLRRAR